MGRRKKISNDKPSSSAGTDQQPDTSFSLSQPLVSPYLGEGRSTRGLRGETISKQGKRTREPDHQTSNHNYATIIINTNDVIIDRHRHHRHHFWMLIFMTGSGLAVRLLRNHLIFHHLTLLIWKADFYSTRLMGVWEVVAQPNGSDDCLPSWPQILASCHGQPTWSSLRDFGLMAKPPPSRQGL